MTSVIDETLGSCSGFRRARRKRVNWGRLFDVKMSGRVRSVLPSQTNGF